MKLEGEKRRRRRLLWASSAAVAFVLTALAVAGVVSYATSQRPRLSEAVFALPKDASHAPANGKPIYFGDGEAPVTLTLFEDFKCTHCHDLNVRLGSNIESLVESGRLRLAIYPMSYMPGGSEAAANAFACSARYGLQRQFYAGLFENIGQDWTTDKLLQLGDLLSAGPDYRACVIGDENRWYLDSVAEEARRRNVLGAPTVYLNDRLVPRALDLSPADLRQMVAAAR
jgi:protein-disulfide isomerase